MAGRVKIKLEWPKKTFYEMFLKSWKESLDATDKMGYSLYKAHGNLKLFPLEVNGISDLKDINGIGATIAVRLETAWQVACEEHRKELNLKEVKNLEKEQLLTYVEMSKNAKLKEKEARQEAINSKKTNLGRVETTDEFIEKPNKFSRIDSLQTLSSKPQSDSKSTGEPATTLLQHHNFTTSNKETNAPSKLKNYQMDTFTVSSQCSERANVDVEIQYVYTQPQDKAEVILICDHRETTRGFKKTKTKGVVELLETTTLRTEMRALSVGDFMWIARHFDGTEMVLDWVVERKTWRDLSDSIRKGRYEEQKARLRTAPMTNRVYLVEGRDEGDQACTQALCTTLVHDNYLIQRCEDARSSADFLVAVTKRLQKRVQQQQLCGIRFDDLQRTSKKTSTETVTETWTRQLMICPGMSFRRAVFVSDRFPSLPSLSDFVSNGGDLSKELPQMPNSLILQLMKFFK